MRILPLAAVVLATLGCGLETSGLSDAATGDGRDGDGIGPHVCGNHRVESGEECDDGNANPGDGCEPDCYFSCHDNSECDDGDQCTEDRCDIVAGGRDCFNRVVFGMDCDDGNPCTYIEATSHDSCEGDPPVCVSGPNHCECVVTADCAPHNPANRCEGTLICQANVCVIDPGTIPVCDTSGDTACRITVCNPDTGVCGPLNRPDGLTCDDGRWCSLTEDCQAGECTQRSPSCPSGTCVSCDETLDSCNVAAGMCAVGGACIAENIKDPDDPCRACLPGDNQWDYTTLGAGADCDDGNFCNGGSTCNSAGACIAGPAPCPSGPCATGCDEGTDSCTFAGSETVCRAATGTCDQPETCNGVDASCPTDARHPSGYVCRAVAGPCDRQETCSGTSDACPPDGFLPDGTECRAASGACGLAETCTGSSAACPEDLHATSRECRAASGACDVAESCNGSSSSCPTDGFLASGTPCAPSTGAPCDVADVCNGSGTTCPPAVASAGTVCNASSGAACDLNDVCDGIGTSCPAVVRAAGYVCHASTDACDPAETCDGTSTSCPADDPVVDDGQPCVSGTGMCCSGVCCGDSADHCGATSHTCRCGGGNACGSTEECCLSGPDAGDCVTRGSCRP